MDRLTYLFIANAAALTGLCGYLVFLALRQNALEARCRRLEALGGDN
ncbi:MAG: CcmD family protein [Desulfovibrionaceae bacterium]|nr:CcmD family protein [Desulfovibrionaceae bacterium]MBF0514934.1 CcmD family protein [Desulfovibrionaceae bacterium]